MKAELKMDACIICVRKVEEMENWISDRESVQTCERYSAPSESFGWRS
jgi:hypothetical protein